MSISWTQVRPIVGADLILAVFQQLVGINIVFYYGAVLWQSERRGRELEDMG